MTARKTKTGRKRTRKPPGPKTTPVPDRSPGVPLGLEARSLANTLQVYLGHREEVPPAGLAWSDWWQKRLGLEKKIPRELIAWALAILEQIPVREDRRPGHPADPLVQEASIYREVLGSIEAARFVVRTKAALKQPGTGEPVSADEIDEPVRADKIEERAQNLRASSTRRAGR